jgi:hypothetical protein
LEEVADVAELVASLVPGGVGLLDATTAVDMVLDFKELLGLLLLSTKCPFPVCSIEE